MSDTVARYYTGWRLLNDRLAEAIGALSGDELAWTPAPTTWPIWALAGHLAGARVYWLCKILHEPGAATTPFTDLGETGWEDDPSRPRHADELVLALRSTFEVIEGCLQRWTPDMLATEFPRERNGMIQMHSRQSILYRLLTHDASHSGEISQTLGSHGRGEVDLWSGLARVLPAAT